MKNIKYIIGSGVLLFLTIFITISCTDDNDWDKDSSHDRLFSVTASSLSVSPEETKAEVKWAKSPSAEYYIIEVSKDTLYNDVPMGEANSIVYGEDKSIVESPYELTDLDSGTKYFIRIKSMSSAKAESKWSYLEKKSFKTKSEQIMNPVLSEDITDNSAVLTWIPGSNVTGIKLLSVDGEQDITLSTENISAGSVKLTGLTGGTAYTAEIYKGTNKRGSVSFVTYSPPPADGVRYDLNGTENIIDFINALTTDESVVLVFPTGSSYIAESDASGTTTNNITIPSNIKSITFYGSPGGKQALLSFKEIKLNDATATIRLEFDNINIKGFDASADYILNDNPSVGRVISEFKIANSTVSTFRGVMRLRGASSVSNYTITNSIVTNIGGYGLLAIDAATVTFGVLDFNNSTIYSLVSSNVLTLKSKPTSVTMTNCTFYDAPSPTKYLVGVDKKTTNIPATFAISNCLFGSSSPLNNFRGTDIKYETNYVFDSYRTSDFAINSGYPFSGISDYTGTTTDLFTDPANGDFTIKDGSFDKDAGDPRWRQ